MAEAIRSEERSAEPAGLVERLAAGDRRVLSRAISWVENDDPRVLPVLEAAYARSRTPWVIGVTGIGGAGKSTLVPQLARRLCADARECAIVAVDPSSPLTGGAVLGDRIRNQDPAAADIYFRSVASRGGHGGLATCVADVIRLLGAAGRRTVIVETVGTGQSEVAVRELAHTTLVVSAPGLGDEVQAMKAGVIEIGSVFAVNKADRPGAEEAVMTLRQALAIAAGPAANSEGAYMGAGGRMAWLPPVIATQALEGRGVDALVERLNAHRAHLETSGDYQRLERIRDRARMMEHAKGLLVSRFLSRAGARGELEAMERTLAAGGIDPLRAARQLVESTG